MELEIAKAYIKGGFHISINENTNVESLRDKLSRIVNEVNETNPVCSLFTSKSDSCFILSFQLDELGKLDTLNDKINAIVEEFEAKDSTLRFEYFGKVMPEEWYFVDARGNHICSGDLVKYALDSEDDRVYKVFDMGWSNDKPYAFAHLVNDSSAVSSFNLNELEKVGYYEAPELIKDEVGSEIVD